ncbi:MAG: hypothetical protein JW793_00570 [Acidobacteria bacterium]|nr:hypothetical protein [Acidobacteriota bacterium]
MRSLRSAFHIILILAILSTGLPLYHSGDVNRDGRVGLSDAVVSVRQLVNRAADDGVAFRDGMENILNSLSVTAGLKSVIRSAREPGSATSVVAMPALIMDGCRFEPLSPLAICPADPNFLYQSPALAPLVPPPNAGIA